MGTYFFDQWLQPTRKILMGDFDRMCMGCVWDICGD